MNTKIRDILGKIWEVRFSPTDQGVDIRIPTYTKSYPINLMNDKYFTDQLDRVMGKKYPGQFYSLIMEKVENNYREE